MNKTWSDEQYGKECEEGEKLMQELVGKVIAEVHLSMTGVTVITTDGVEIFGGGDNGGVRYPDNSFINNILGRYHLSTTFVEESD